LQSTLRNALNTLLDDDDALNRGVEWTCFLFQMDDLPPQLCNVASARKTFEFVRLGEWFFLWIDRERLTAGVR
jgi:hypothetical protein